MNTEYNPWEIEARWRARWAEEHVYRTLTLSDGNADARRTFYCLDFFPYPSGAGLSVGHGRNYVPSDAIARYHRMRGDAVLHPMGWDAFGLPAENEAIKTGAHPADSTARYAANYRRQLDMLGCSYDWEREINSADPAYYRWNQHFFLMLYQRGLAYRAEAPVNWCESCQTVLAAEEIEHGACWRCHTPVVQRTRKQWYIRVTAYADELHADLARLDWPEHILAMQRHWIGRSEGVEIELKVMSNEKEVMSNEKEVMSNEISSPMTHYPLLITRYPLPITPSTITVFTTRPDTWFGVTFVALSPEHPLAESIAAPEQRDAVRAYIAAAGQRTPDERHTRELDGVFTGAYAAIPGGDPVPIYVADYVLGEYGAGAVMGVPAHDTRDFAFAQKYALPIKTVIVPPGGGSAPLPATDPGILVHSGTFDGMASEDAITAIAAWMEAEGFGKRAVHFRLRDWLISRQRYWGTPIPIIHCPVCGEVPAPEADLPVTLPPLPNFRPRGDGRAPLANAPDFVNTVCPRCGGPAERETDTMTGFVCSSWYYMRFTDPHNPARPFDPAQAARWLPVDVYVGGAEHAVGHLLYSRFWTKTLADAGLVDFREPFPALRSQGVLHARDPETGKVERMSKSKGNVVTPESVIERYGADVTRLHLLFMGPFEANVIWEVEADGVTPQHIEGVRRFLQRVWRLAKDENISQRIQRNSTEKSVQSVQSVEPESEEETPEDTMLRRAMHRAVREVTEQTEALHFNKAISALMTFSGDVESYQRQFGATAEGFAACATLVKLLAPFAPFIAEEIWRGWGNTASVHIQPWPAWDAALAQAGEVEIAVQVNGKVRDRIRIPADANEDSIRQRALAAPGVQRALEQRAVRHIVIVPGRVVNIVT